MPKSAAAALARLTGLSNLSLQADQITPAVVDSALALSRLTSLALHPVEGLLPAQRLADLPQRLLLLTYLELSEGRVEGEGLEDAQLPAPADFPHLRTVWLRVSVQPPPLSGGLRYSSVVLAPSVQSCVHAASAGLLVWAHGTSLGCRMSRASTLEAGHDG